jgi:hypothetical protein
VNPVGLKATNFPRQTTNTAGLCSATLARFSHIMNMVVSEVLRRWLSRVSSSGGASLSLSAYQFTANALFSSGLRAGFTNEAELPHL